MSLLKQNQYGTIEITNEAVAYIAGSVTTSCYGVVGMAYKNRADGLVNLLKRDNIDKGVKVTFDGDGVLLELHIIAEYGVNINTISESIINTTKYTIENLTGLSVRKVQVCVDSVRVDR